MEQVACTRCCEVLQVQNQACGLLKAACPCTVLLPEPLTGGMQFEPPVVITSPYGKLDQYLDKSGLQAFPLTDSLLQASSVPCQPIPWTGVGYGVLFDKRPPKGMHSSLQ